MSIKSIPRQKNIIKYLLLLYFLPVGKSSHKDIWSIIPAIAENSIPRIISFIKFFKNKNAISAPKGSDKEEIKVYNKAFFLLPVE